MADSVMAFDAENVHAPLAVGEPPIVPPKVGEVAKTRLPVPVAPAGVTPPIEIWVPKVCSAVHVFACARLMSSVVFVLVPPTLKVELGLVMVSPLPPLPIQGG